MTHEGMGRENWERAGGSPNFGVWWFPFKQFSSSNSADGALDLAVNLGFITLPDKYGGCFPKKILGPLSTVQWL